MSAALLHDNSKCNKLEDDPESCLHVLTWMALRFTDHTISEAVQADYLELLMRFMKTKTVLKVETLRKVSC